MLTCLYIDKIRNNVNLLRHTVPPFENPPWNGEWSIHVVHMHIRQCQLLLVGFFVHLPGSQPGGYYNRTACHSVNTALLNTVKHRHTSMGLGELARYCLYISEVTIYPLPSISHSSSSGFLGFICSALKLPSITMLLENFRLSRLVSWGTFSEENHYVLAEIDVLISWNINTQLWTCQAEKHQLSEPRIRWTFMEALPFHQF